ncbi:MULTISPECIES: hypothetical protein [Variovorax]|jgi:hypothetical protein|uniref:hypothetical protein n=1 Tax=Variovorax TaxID=34072 RepID=UPI00086F27DF|nr:MULTISPECIES: hypothetical protein [Variovorax]MBN8754049.1 hypothetical protein [Variovorax sp.]ODU15259.1 MAG: hypothetical protein ABS94_18525 [Variovorax sp. SCN 67-85]ODV26634.1 MAG: hypothetical protein ABT25_05020 [Variovorax sp. SCN 67-20]OJZ04612.1 MAG: hypothetical protein BGP22_14350 [Variovorax sp. 67-131]UKI09813.1 hypothetical protein L3V85_08195 [Variovorax paradoxus]
MKSNTRSMILALLAVGGLTATTIASAAGESASTYQQELAVCGHNQQDRAACIREAGAARQAAARGGLTSAPDYRANALARCSLQPPTERSACEARVLGSMGNTRSMVDGSVMGGGVIRESVTTTMVPVVPAPEPMPMPMRPMR